MRGSSTTSTLPRTRPRRTHATSSQPPHRSPRPCARSPSTGRWSSSTRTCTRRTSSTTPGDDRLGFIDFGETFVGAAAWEFASIAYFLGWADGRRDPPVVPAEADDLDAWRVAGRRISPCASACRAGNRIETWRSTATPTTRRSCGRRSSGSSAASPLLPSAAMEIMGIQIRTIVKDNVARDATAVSRSSTARRGGSTCSTSWPPRRRSRGRADRW